MRVILTLGEKYRCLAKTLSFRARERKGGTMVGEVCVEMQP